MATATIPNLSSRNKTKAERGSTLSSSSRSKAKTAPVRNILIDSISVDERLRPLGDVHTLAESIKQLGLLNPITITSSHKLIAGLHRLEACKQLGWKTIAAKLLKVTETEAALLECDENLIRNDLSVLERAEHYLRRKDLYEELHPETKQGGWRGNRHTGGISSKTNSASFCLETGNSTHRSARTIQKLIQIAKLLHPETKSLIRNTEWAQNQLKLRKLSKLPHDLQIAVGKKVSNGQAHLVNDAISQVEQERFRSRRSILPLEGRDYQLIEGDFREVGHLVPSSSVNLIITDAPYETPDLYVFKPLSVFANRVLKEGGSMLCMVGQYHMPRILADLSEYMEYQWMIATTFNGMATFIANKYVNCAWKPVLWFTKPPYRGKAIRDLIQTGQKDKRFHPHGQSVDEFAKLIGWLTKEGDTVMDCFVGGGSTAVATLAQHRRFIGIDKQRKYIETTKRRIEEVIKKK